MMTIINRRKKVSSHQVKNDNIVLSVNNVSKKFCRDLKLSLFYGVQDISSELLGFRKKNDRLRKKEFWVLDDINFELRKGESIGLVGKNGSGKSTLLRIIAGLIKPDSGFVEVSGRIAPLIALGAGFNPILTGRENIYVNMAILGLSKDEIDQKYDQVVEFAEIGNAIDAPVQTYSSGMSARLGFSSAIHTNPDILLVDEVLSVGDANFRAKCERRLHQLRESGTAYVIVSHHSPSILSACKSAIYLLDGKIIASGDVEKVINKYEDDLFDDGREQSSGAMFKPAKSLKDSAGLDITSLFFRDHENNIISSPISGELIKLCIGCKTHINIQNVNVRLAISEVGGDESSVLYLGGNNDHEYFDFLPGNYEIQINMPHFVLGPGTYTMYLYLRKDSFYCLDIIDTFVFKVISNGRMLKSKVYQSRSWKLVNLEKNNEE